MVDVVVNVVSQVELLHLLHLECFLVWHSKVIAVLYLLEVAHQASEFNVILIIFERDDGDAVRKLVAERVDCIVNYNQILEIPIFEDPQILDVDPIFSWNALVSVQTVLDVFILRVDVINDNVSVILVTSCEYHDFEILVYHLQALLSERSDVEARSHFLTRLEDYAKLDIWRSVWVLFPLTVS